MNITQLKKNIYQIVELVPAAFHLDEAGDVLPATDDAWKIVAISDDHVQIALPSGLSYRLGKDHIHHFTTDAQRSGDVKRGFLTLHVQLFVRGDEVSAVPNERPGWPVAPSVNRALRARAVFAPELERVFRRQVQVLNRVIPNYCATSVNNSNCPGDSWTSLTPYTADLYPSAPVFQDLSAADAQLLAEFYASVQEVRLILGDWNTASHPLSDYNAWNVLMHKVQHSLRVGEAAVRRFCPDRQYDATMPAGGTLLSQSERAIKMADDMRANFIARRQNTK